MEITKRESIVSVAIVAVMMILGFVITESIQENLLEKYQIYDTAIKIDSEELFRHGMETNTGHAFVYGELKTVDPVSFPEIKGKYSYIKKEEQEYRKHTRYVEKTYTDSEGNTYTKEEEEEYWTWDTMKTETKTATKITFLNVEFNYSKIPLPSSQRIKILDTGYHKRNVYYGKKTEYTGTIFTTLKDSTISETSFYEDKTIPETIDNLESGYQIVIFWIFWIIFTGLLVFLFYYLENRWLK